MRFFRRRPRRTEPPEDRVERIPQYDLRPSRMLTLWQAYQLMREGGGDFQMQMLNESSYALTVNFVVARPMILLSGERCITARPGENYTYKLTVFIDKESDTDRP